MEKALQYTDKVPLSCNFMCNPVNPVRHLVTLRLSLQSCLDQPFPVTASRVLTACELQLRLHGRYPGKSWCQKLVLFYLGLYLHLKFLGKVSKTWKKHCKPLAFVMGISLKNVDFGPKFWGTQSSISQAFEHNLKCLFKWLHLVKHFLLITGCWPQLYACFRNHELHNLVCLHFKYPLKFGDICLNRSHVRSGHKWILFGNFPRYHVCEEDGDFVAHQGPDYRVCAWEWGDAGRGSCEWLSYCKTVDVGWDLLVFRLSC